MHGVEGVADAVVAVGGSVPVAGANTVFAPLQSGLVTPPEFVPDYLLFPGWQYVVAVVVLFLSVVVSKYVVRLLGRPVARQFTRQSVAQTVLRIVRLSVFLAGSVVAANLLGFELGNIVLSVTVFSAVLGIVLAPIVGSIINGVFVLVDQPYEIGDMIELDDGTRGFVDEINLSYTKMFTLDNTFLVMPNSNIRDRDVINYSAEDERTRMTLDVLVTYESDLDRARELIELAARDCDQVLEGGPDIRVGSARYPAKPTAYIASYADNGVLLRLRYWASKPYKMPRIQSDVQTRLWNLLGESDANVEFAYPHTHVVFDDTSGSLRIGDGGENARHAVASPPSDGGESETVDSDAE
ncbi:MULTISPECIES: mechanosensitive ion channel family protein [Haloferax]|uniref:Mechanosensitive ion channel n=1 Tax=Haloferax marinum TaxID=2666143 RepID=A0A6A8G9Z4_9EURY|nr:MULTISPECIES: mechanosensitive ion channel family protein [Haloferax]KAB1198724.1 mechanosensitive ion channel family protein [Haloferax sp. CBA1150]MRW97841.1 mechanosensitive ion channel [Haloferax marinum]